MMNDIYEGEMRLIVFSYCHLIVAQVLLVVDTKDFFYQSSMYIYPAKYNSGFHENSDFILLMKYFQTFEQLV